MVRTMVCMITHTIARTTRVFFFFLKQIFFVFKITRQGYLQYPKNYFPEKAFPESHFLEMVFPEKVIPKRYYPYNPIPLTKRKAFFLVRDYEKTTDKSLYLLPKLFRILPYRKDYRQVSPIEKATDKSPGILFSPYEKTTDKSRCTPYPEKLRVQVFSFTEKFS